MLRPDNVPHHPRSCWKDLYYSLMEAKEIICITGWAVWTGFIHSYFDLKCFCFILTFTCVSVSSVFCFICLSVSSVFLFHLCFCFISVSVSSVFLFHLSFCFICLSVSSVFLCHLSFCFICLSVSSVFLFHLKFHQCFFFNTNVYLHAMLCYNLQNLKLSFGIIIKLT